MKYVLKTFNVLFSLFFIVILFNTIFYNRTIGIDYGMLKMIFMSLGLFIFIYALYKLLKNYCKSKSVMI